MKRIMKATIIFLLSNPIQGLAQTTRIPVIPYSHSAFSVETKIHNKCKFKIKYSNCAKRYLRRY